MTSPLPHESGPARVSERCRSTRFLCWVWSATTICGCAVTWGLGTAAKVTRRLAHNIRFSRPKSNGPFSSFLWFAFKSDRSSMQDESVILRDYSDHRFVLHRRTVRFESE